MHPTHFCKLIIFGALTMLMASCSKTNTQGKLIPKEAALVMQLDGKSLTSKLPWDEIKQNALFQEMKNDSTLPATLKNLLDNPDNAGIDTKNDLLFFVVKDSLGGYIGFEGKVKDPAVFKTFNQQITEKGVESEIGDAQFISKSPVCVGWTNEHFVYIFDMPQISRMDELSRRMIRDSIDISSTRKPRDIGAACKAIFALKESNSLAKNEKFTSLMKAAGDVRFWMNSEELNKGASSSAALAMLNMEKFYKGNVTAGTLNFENGKILMNATTYASEDMINLFKKYSGGKISEDMIKRMPGKDVVGIMALNFKPEAIRDLIKMTGLDGLINMGVQKLGFTMDDFIKANKGDILIGLSDLVVKPDTSMFKFKDQDEHFSISQKPSFNFIFAASIGDKDAFNKIVNAGKALGGQMGDSSKMPIAYKSNGTYFALSNNQQNVDQYLGTASNNFDFISKISGEPFGGYLDIQTILKAFGTQATKDSAAKIAYDASLKMWDNVLWKGGNYSNEGMQQTVEINLVDKSTNSLKQLNQYSAMLSELYREQKRKQREEMMAFQEFESTDTTQPSPPVKTK